MLVGIGMFTGGTIWILTHGHICGEIEPNTPSEPKKKSEPKITAELWKVNFGKITLEGELFGISQPNIWHLGVLLLPGISTSRSRKNREFVSTVGPFNAFQSASPQKASVVTGSDRSDRQKGPPASTPWVPLL